MNILILPSESINLLEISTVIDIYNLVTDIIRWVTTCMDWKREEICWTLTVMRVSPESCIKSDESSLILSMSDSFLQILNTMACPVDKKWNQTKKKRKCVIITNCFTINFYWTREREKKKTPRKNPSPSKVLLKHAQHLPRLNVNYTNEWYWISKYLVLRFSSRLKEKKRKKRWETVDKYFNETVRNSTDIS